MRQVLLKGLFWERLRGKLVHFPLQSIWNGRDWIYPGKPKSFHYTWNGVENNFIGFALMWLLKNNYRSPEIRN
jgi:hypothetical protein